LSKEKIHQYEHGTTFSSAFLVELVYRVKDTLGSIKSFTLLSIDKFDDMEFRKYSLNSVAEDIKKIDSVLNSLLNYININTPLIKTNTVPLVLEGILDAHKKQLQDKRIRVIKKFDRDLPETTIHEEQVRFILNSVLQYTILSTPENGTIGLLIKSSHFQKGAGDKKSSPEVESGYIEISIGFMAGKKTVESLKDTSDLSLSQRAQAIDLILKLVREIIQKNHGMMTLQVDKKKMRALITLKFPIERRKVIYY